jgi:hypothetical protein
MFVHMTYEFVYDRFSDPDAYILRELRVMGNHTRALSAHEIEAFRMLIAQRFINELLLEADQAIRLTSNNGIAADSLVVLGGVATAGVEPAAEPQRRRLFALNGTRPH